VEVQKTSTLSGVRKHNSRQVNVFHGRRAAPQQQFQSIWKRLLAPRTNK
jgi:hypothetical protein